jgi:hypothetical protein
MLLIPWALDQFGTAAREIAINIANEDGVRAGCDVIEGVLARSSGTAGPGHS